jgi:predicted nuclease of restriction endonuclease-like RecB superfamily
MDSPLPPTEIRAKVFAKAREMGPVALDAGPLGRTTAADVLAAVAVDLQCSPEQIADALYADLRDHERITAHALKDVDGLLHRYNIALVQGCLLHATEVRIRLHDASPARVRQLLRSAKFHQLSVSATAHEHHLDLVVDGPATLLAQSTRYGLELAAFFPALLLQDSPWEAEATVLWTKARIKKTLRISHEDGLVAERADIGGYQSRELTSFIERFGEHQRGWTLGESPRVLALGDRSVVVPDLQLTHEDGRVAYLEILGFWTQETLERRLSSFDRYDVGNVIVAISRKRRTTSALATVDDPRVITFTEVVPLATVLDTADRIGVQAD